MKSRPTLIELAESLGDDAACLLCFERDHTECHREMIVEAVQELQPELAVSHPYTTGRVRAGVAPRVIAVEIRGPLRSRSDAQECDPVALPPMARTWLTIRVELLSGIYAECDPAPGRVFLVWTPVCRVARSLESISAPCLSAGDLRESVRPGAGRRRIERARCGA
jgi:hypothetical protein